jgi:hypothetical protein
VRFTPGWLAKSEAALTNDKKKGAGSAGTTVATHSNQSPEIVARPPPQGKPPITIWRNGNAHVFADRAALLVWLARLQRERKP